MKLLRINLGCGEDWKGDGVINFDWRNLTPPPGIIFLRGDVINVEDYFEWESAEEVWALEILEHFGQHETRRLLDDWIRLLKPGGILHLETPDLEALARFILQTGKDPVWSDEQLGKHVYGVGDYPGGYHKMGFTRKYLRQLLEERGMTVLSITGTPRCHTSLYITACR
jgi:predicted SAM-dependent methyltransferase